MVVHHAIAVGKKFCLGFIRGMFIVFFQISTVIMGEKIYCETLRLIVAAWDGKPDSFCASVLRGMMHFVELYHGEFSEERLVRALGSVHPMEIYRVGRDNPAKLPGWKKYVFPIYMAYNGKGRKDALPMKF